MPPDEVALLIVEGGPTDESGTFTAKLTRFDTLPLRQPPSKSEILPGEHAIEVAWIRKALAPGPKKAWVRTGIGVETIAFEAREGKVYRIVWGDGRPSLRVDKDAAE